MEPDALRHVEHKHRFYADVHQRPRDDSEFMAAHGHPFAEAYREMRAHFDSLKYACNSATRRISYAGEDEHSEQHAPDLWVSWDVPRALVSRERGVPAHVYPAMGRPWDLYLEALAKAGWPKEANPRLDGGFLHVTTRDPDFRRELGALGFAPDCDSQMTLGFPDLGRFREAVALIKRRHAACLLPKRTAADDAEDSKPLPLAEKPFLYANVEAVTETARAVLVPTVPISPEGDRVALDNLSRLSALVDRGFPWDNCRAYFAEFLKPDAFRKIDRARRARNPEAPA